MRGLQVIIRDLDPKAITTQELYGYVNMATREWKDGLLSSIMRELANVPDDNPKWILLDGDLDANWCVTAPRFNTFPSRISLTCSFSV
jgi:dynein heavy chain, axonemal